MKEYTHNFWITLRKVWKSSSIISWLHSALKPADEGSLILGKIFGLSFAAGILYHFAASEKKDPIDEFVFWMLIASATSLPIIGWKIHRSQDFRKLLQKKAPGICWILFGLLIIGTCYFVFIKFGDNDEFNSARWTRLGGLAGLAGCWLKAAWEIHRSQTQTKNLKYVKYCLFALSLLIVVWELWFIIRIT
jgi:hypothetical protein